GRGDATPSKRLARRVHLYHVLYRTAGVDPRLGRHRGGQLRSSGPAIRLLGVAPYVAFELRNGVPSAEHNQIRD
ncbi:hypothetical protein BgiMline_032081, partial [Biomphalaria glabrata]